MRKAGVLCSVQKDAKKTGGKPRKNRKIPLTNNGKNVKMIFHTVILCLFVAIPSNMVILSQVEKNVKMKVM